ncbi:aromatic prenyltransferase (DMATS family) [Aspergillus melleus]|uniref:Aromatic prenyltransferase (DMATS family) n=1 Tax=Aspergillus melleus TaxID=138277 RepID=A0ACC3ATX1_9EURO|nr:aromatic prenyltransferase (DMATS family) [Aspergillus melleus]
MTISSNVAGANGKDATAPTPWDVIAKYGCFSNEYELQWWRDSGALVARYLQMCGYPLNEQYAYLLFFRQVVVPALGPYPPVRRSFLNEAKIGLELSINFESSGHPIFRMTLDAVNADSGNRLDPFNDRAVASLVDKLALIKPKGFDRTLYHRFMDDFVIPDGQADKIYEETTLAERWASSMLAFDFKKGDVGVKEYFWPQMASRAHGKSIHEMLRNSLSRLEGQMVSSAAAELVMKYMEGSNNHLREIVFFAWDFVQVEKSRLKLYIWEKDLSIAKVEELWTLGGKLKGPAIDEGFELVKKLWNIMKMGERKPWLPFLFNYEISPGKPDPLPKVYFPIDDGNDLETALAIAEWFRVLGWNDKADAYVDQVRYLQPGRDLSKTSGLQTLVIFSFKSTGPYTTIYYHPTATSPSA